MLGCCRGTQIGSTNNVNSVKGPVSNKAGERSARSCQLLDDYTLKRNYSYPASTSSSITPVSSSTDRHSTARSRTMGAGPNGLLSFSVFRLPRTGSCSTESANLSEGQRCYEYSIRITYRIFLPLKMPFCRMIGGVNSINALSERIFPLLG